MDEILAVILVALVFIGLAIAVCYMWMLARFFKELRRKEPEVWRAIGSPSLADMLCLPLIRFRKFYAFLPIVKARRYDDAYGYASRVYVLLHIGLAYSAVLLCFAMVSGFYIVFWG